MRDLHLSGSEASLSSLVLGPATPVPQVAVPATPGLQVPGPATPVLQVFTSVTTPVPDSNPLDGGILMEEPYQTDAYDRFPGEETYLAMPYRAVGGSGLLDSGKEFPPEILAAFDTNKVASRGTLQRLKFRSRGEEGELHSDLEVEEMEEDGESQKHSMAGLI